MSTRPSQDEYEQWAERLERLAPQEHILHAQRPQVKQLMESGHLWYRAMMMLASGYYDVNPSTDPGRHAAAAAIMQLILTHRRGLRISRTDYCAIAGTYAALLVKMWGICGEFQERHLGKSDPMDFNLILTPAPSLLEEAVKANPGELKLEKALEMVRHCSVATRSAIKNYVRGSTTHSPLTSGRMRWMSSPELAYAIKAAQLQGLQFQLESVHSTPDIPLHSTFAATVPVPVSKSHQASLGLRCIVGLTFPSVVASLRDYQVRIPPDGTRYYVALGSGVPLSPYLVVVTRKGWIRAKQERIGPLQVVSDERGGRWVVSVVALQSDLPSSRRTEGPMNEVAKVFEAMKPLSIILDA